MATVRPTLVSALIHARRDAADDGLSAGGIAKELETTPAAVKKALATLKIDADFVKAGCAYYYTDRIPKVRQALA